MALSDYIKQILRKALAKNVFFCEAFLWSY